MTEEVERRLSRLEALSNAQYLLIAALIQTHPRHEDWQLAATAALEIFLARSGSTLEPDQQELVRAHIEETQRLIPLRPGAAADRVRKHLPR